MAFKIGFKQNENNENYILIELGTEELIKLERIFKSMSHCLTEFIIGDILSLDETSKFSMKLKNMDNNIGVCQLYPDRIEWNQRSETWYIFRNIISEMRYNSHQKMEFELTRDIRNQNEAKIFISWEA